MTEDVVLTSGGSQIRGGEEFKGWVRAFRNVFSDVHLEPVETFQTADGSRVTSRWM